MDEVKHQNSANVYITIYNNGETLYYLVFVVKDSDKAVRLIKAKIIYDCLNQIKFGVQRGMWVNADTNTITCGQRGNWH